ncbi:MAG: phosphatase PAP2 family protein [Candidatus Taylorbacteria bacterium]
MQFFTNLDTSAFFLLHNFAGIAGWGDLLITFLAVYLPFILPIVFLVLLFRSGYSRREKTRIACVAFFSALVSSFIIATLIHTFYFHPRPFISYGLEPLFLETSNSFPSLHATFFFAFSTAIYFYNKKWGISLFFVTLLMTIARVMAGVHYPSDILGGFAIGVVVAYLSVKYLVPKIRKITY